MIRNLAVVIALFVSNSSAFASENIQVWARAYHNGCSYYSSSTADFSVTLKDDSLPYGTKVTLISGLGGSEVYGAGAVRPFTWRDRKETSMEAISEYTWMARRGANIKTRSSAWAIDAINFVFKIEEPGRAPRFVNGGTTWGFWSSSFDFRKVQCATSNNLPEYKSLKVEHVEKD